LLPFDYVEDDHKVDEDRKKGKEVDKEEEREMIEGVDNIRVDAKEKELYFPILNEHIRVHLQHHVCGALRELHVRVLHLPEQHGLGVDNMKDTTKAENTINLSKIRKQV
jgi:hypothetical protein